MCVAVGDGESRAGADLTFAELWNGSAWRLSLTPNPGGADDSFMQAVSCVSESSCVAVGHYQYEVREVSQQSAALVERWNGTRWSIERSPNHTGMQGDALQDVDCPSTRRCTAVGWELTSKNTYVPLALSWDGSAWTPQTVPAFRGSPDTELNAVACAREDACTAVGFTQQRNGAVSLAMSWNGSAWATQRVPGVAGAADTALNGIDCPSADRCLAVGGYRTRSLLQRALAAVWNGSRWTVAAVATPPAAG
jgi:hypothetical protein